MKVLVMVNAPAYLYSDICELLMMMLHEVKKKDMKLQNIKHRNYFAILAGDF